MKIRLMGEQKLITMWANELKECYGINWKYYPNRGSSKEGRIYMDLDDREAEKIILQQTQKNNINNITQNFIKIENK